MSTSYLHLFNIRKVNAFSLNMSVVYAYALIYSTSKVYMYVLFDVAFGLDGPGIESRLGRDFRHLFRPALRPLSLLYNGYQGFLWGKVRPGRDADTSTPSSAEVKNRVLSLRVFVVYERVKPTYLLFDVVSVDVYCVSSCSNVIRLDVFRIIRFEIKVKNV